MIKYLIKKHYNLKQGEAMFKFISALTNIIAIYLLLAVYKVNWIAVLLIMFFVVITNFIDGLNRSKI